MVSQKRPTTMCAYKKIYLTIIHSAVVFVVVDPISVVVVLRKFTQYMLTSLSMSI